MFGQVKGIKPRNGLVLIVAIVARISGCANQKEISLEDQIDHAKQVVAELYDGQVEYRIIQTKGKGERLDRPELEQVEHQLRSRELDLLIMEDLGRLVRGTEAASLCGLAVDAETRVLAPNDFIDTADDSWEEDVISACRDHVGHNSHTSKRLKFKLMNRFMKFGGATARPIAGYAVPADAKTYNDWHKLEEATPIIREGLRRLRESLNCSAVAEFFNRVPWQDAIGFPTGPYCSNGAWTGQAVRRYFKNSLLGGHPGRGFKRTVKHHESGRRIPQPNPEGPKFIDCPHLAHLDPDELSAVNAALQAENANCGRKKINGVDPLWRVPRKATSFPAPIARCVYCGRRSVWGGNGVTEHLMCAGSREWKCWNSIGFSGPLATGLVMKVITAELQQLDGFGDQFRALIQQARSSHGDAAQRQRKLQQAEEQLARKKQNALNAMREYGANDIVQQLLAETNAEDTRLTIERRAVEALGRRQLQLPETVAELREKLAHSFQELSQDSREFNNLLRTLVPEFDVFLVRLCDGGHLLPRAKIKLALDGFVPDAQHVPGLTALLEREVMIDLFVPPQREIIRGQAVTMVADGMEQRRVAAQLKVTQPTVQNALALEREMRELRLQTPYVVVRSPPDDYPKLRRHKNSKYHFDPLADYQPPAI